MAPQELKFIANRPFLFALKIADEMLFVGRLNKT